MRLGAGIDFCRIVSWRCGAVGCDAVRCGAVLCGAVLCGAVRSGVWLSNINIRYGAMRCAGLPFAKSNGAVGRGRPTVYARLNGEVKYKYKYSSLPPKC